MANTYIWQRDLADILRTDPVLAPKVIEWSGWKDRGRPPEQFSFAPSGKVVHHTGCFARVGHDPASCVNFIIAGNQATGVPGPISQMLGCLTRPGTRWDGTNLDPHIVLIAAGRANHAGNGVYPWGAPAGNGSSIAGEWCGPMTRWPDEYVEFRRRVQVAILRGRGWPVNRLVTHHAYALPIDGRKKDPSGAWVRQPGLDINTPWNLPMWLEYVDEDLTPPTPPTPDPPTSEESDMTWRVAKWSQTGGFFIGDGDEALWVSDDGGDIDVTESLIRMAPGAVNVKPLLDGHAVPGENVIVTTWDAVGLVNTMNIRRYIGENPKLT